jgi:hypothetical protein
MKNLILSCLALFSFIINSSAQFTIEDGPIMEKNDAGKICKILGGDKKYFYTFIENGKGKGQRYFIEQYSITDFSKGFSKQLPIQENAQDIESYYTGEQSLFFYCTLESKKTTSNLFYCSVDRDGNASQGIELAKIENKDPERNLIVFPSFYFTINISPDKKHIAIVTRSYENNGKDLKLMLTVYNSATMSKEWDKDISDMGGKNFIIDNAGTVMYISYASETDERNLVIVNKADNGLTTIPLVLKSNQIIEGVNIVSANNVAVVGGFFKEMDAKKAGTFCQQFDMTSKKIIKSDQQYLSDDLVNSLFGKEVKKKGLAGVIEIKFDDKYIDIDDAKQIGSSFYFIGKDVQKDYINKEHTTYSSHTTFSMPTSSSHGQMGSTTTQTSRTSTTHSATYNSDKVIIFKINADGKTEWVKDVSASSSTPVAPMAFLVSSNISMRPEIIDFTLGDKLILIHGDVKFVGMSLKSSNVSYTSFGEKGVVESEKLCADDKSCFLYNAMGIYGYFNIYYQYGKNMIVFYNQKEMQHFSRITFK